MLHIEGIGAKDGVGARGMVDIDNGREVLLITAAYRSCNLV